MMKSMQLLLLALFNILEFMIVNAYIACHGNFDVYFVLDRSASTGLNYRSEIIPFAQNMVANFVNKNVQVSLIWFGTEGHLALPLTDDHNLVQDTLYNMRTEPDPTVAQGTNIGGGLEQVQLRENEDVNKLVFVVSDGCDKERYQENTIRQAQYLKQTGVEIYVVYIPSGGENCPDYLREQIAGRPIEDHFFPIMEELMYEQLRRSDFIDNIISKSCLQIDSVTPDTLCGEARKTVRVNGKGFLMTEDLSKFYCRFEDCKDNEYFVDAYGQSCSFYEQNPSQCITGYYAQSSELEVHCPAACNVCQGCKDDPLYAGIQCETWALMGECDTNSEWMGLHCKKSCGRCGESQRALVLSDDELVCRSPPLRNSGLFYFEITRNGKTWTHGHHMVNTIECEGVQDDIDPFIDPSIRSELSLAVDVKPASYDSTNTLIQMLFEVTNTGQTAINDPIRVYSDVVGTYCPTGILSPGESIICEAQHLTTYDDLLRGDITQVVYAGGDLGDQEIITKKYQLTIPSTWVPPPSAFPTNSPTQRPTQRPTRRQTLHPTLRPTLRPTQRPTLRPTQRPSQSPSETVIDKTQSVSLPPSSFPTISPTQKPTVRPTDTPTQNPTKKKRTRRPTLSPTMVAIFPIASPITPTPKPTMQTSTPTLGTSNLDNDEEEDTLVDGKDNITSPDDIKTVVDKTPDSSPDREDIGPQVFAQESEIIEDACEQLWPPSSIQCIPWWIWLIAGLIILLPLMAVALCCNKRKTESVSKNEILNKNPYESATPSPTPRADNEDGEYLLEDAATKAMPPPLPKPGPPPLPTQQDDSKVVQMSYNTMSGVNVADEAVVQMSFATLTKEDTGFDNVVPQPQNDSGGDGGPPRHTQMGFRYVDHNI